MSHGQSLTMSRTVIEEKNLARVLEMYREVIIAMNPDKVEAYLSPDYIQHSALAEPGLDPLKTFLAKVRKESPDAKQTIHRSFGAASG